MMHIFILINVMLLDLWEKQEKEHHSYLDFKEKLIL